MRRDRHGRAGRGDNDRRRRPFDGFRMHNGRRFNAVVADAVSALPSRLAAPLEGFQIVVDEVPGADERHADGSVALVSCRPPILRVHRRPLEARASSRADLEELVRLAVGEALARGLGLDDDLDDLFGDSG